MRKIVGLKRTGLFSFSVDNSMCYKYVFYVGSLGEQVVSFGDNCSSSVLQWALGVGGFFVEGVPSNHPVEFIEAYIPAHLSVYLISPGNGFLGSKSPNGPS